MIFIGACAVAKSGFWPVAHGFDIVTIRTNDEGAIVVGVILGPQTGRSVVLAAGSDARR
jgi:hypothetical protein